MLVRGVLANRVHGAKPVEKDGRGGNEAFDRRGRERVFRFFDLLVDVFGGDRFGVSYGYGFRSEEADEVLAINANRIGTFVFRQKPADQVGVDVDGGRVQVLHGRKMEYLQSHWGLPV